MAADRWPQQIVLVLLFGILALIVAVDVALGSTLVISGSYATPAVLAAALTTVRRTAVVAAVAVSLSVISGAWNENFGTFDWTVRLVLSAALGVLAVFAAWIRTQREQDLQHMTLIAETAQRAVLRAIPSAVGSVGFAARYVSATRQALVGGDFYEVADSPFGARVIVGDVRGKGLDAVQLAGNVLGGFRRSAFTQPSLRAIAMDLDRIVSAVAGDEDFVTALLAEFHDDHTVTMVNCGHHPPLLIKATDTAELVPTGEPVPPLGLSPAPVPVTSTWPDDGRLLLYTDGLIEARNNHGAFFPLTDHAVDLREGTLDDALERLLSHLSEHAGAQIIDDLALVLVEHRSR